jgi:hypothetical protein
VLSFRRKSNCKETTKRKIEVKEDTLVEHYGPPLMRLWKSWGGVVCRSKSPLPHRD